MATTPILILMAITPTPMVIMVLGRGVRVTGVMADEGIMVIEVRVTGVMVDGVITVIGVPVTGVMVERVIMVPGVRVTEGMVGIADSTFFGQ